MVMDITENGTYTPYDDNSLIKSVNVNVPVPRVQYQRSLYFSELGFTFPSGNDEVSDLQTAVINPSSGYDAIGRIRINTQTQNKIITSNGTYYSDNPNVILKKITVNVPQSTFTTKSITSNGTYNASDDGYNGYSSVTVNVPPPNLLLEKSITSNGTYSASSDGYDGYSSVVVNVSPNVTTKSSTVSFEGFSQPSNNNQTTGLQNKYFYAFTSGYDGYSTFVYSLKIQYITITSNGTYYPTDDNTAIRKVVVNVSPSLTTKTITSNGTYYASNDGYNGYSSVTVSGIPSTKYVWIVNMPYVGVNVSFSQGSNVTNNPMGINKGYLFIFFNQTSNSIIIRYRDYNDTSTQSKSFDSVTNWKYVATYIGNVTLSSFPITFYDKNYNTSYSMNEFVPINGRVNSFEYELNTSLLHLVVSNS